MFISDETLSHMRIPGLRLQLKELIECLQRWSDLRRIQEKWSQREKKKRKVEDMEGSEKEGACGGTDVQIFPLREVQGGRMIHAPWSRSDLFNFTDKFPKLRE